MIEEKRDDLQGASKMTLAEIWPTLRSLSIDDKRLLIQALTADLVREEEASLIKVGGSYAVWSPFNSDEAAATLLRLLNETESNGE